HEGLLENTLAARHRAGTCRAGSEALPGAIITDEIAPMTTDERIDAISKKLDMIAQLHLDAERRHEEWRGQWRERELAVTNKLDLVTQLHLDADRRHEEWREQLTERILAAEERADEAEERHNRELAALRADLRHAVELGL